MPALQSVLYAKLNALVHRNMGDIAYYRDRLHVSDPAQASVILDSLIDIAYVFHQSLLEMALDRGAQ